jgi:hypothetical protein
VVPVPVPATLTVDVTKVERSPVGVSGMGRDVATGVVASVSLDVEFGARLDDVIVYTLDEGDDWDARGTSEDDRGTIVSPGGEPGDDNSVLLALVDTEDPEGVSSEAARDEESAAGGLAGAEIVEFPRVKLVAVGPEVSDEEDGEVSVMKRGAAPYTTKAGVLVELLVAVGMDAGADCSDVEPDRVSTLAGDDGIPRDVATGVVSRLIDDELLELGAAEIGGTYVVDEAAALGATSVLSVIRDELIELGAADDTRTTDIEDDAAMLVATGVLSVLTEVVPDDPVEYVIDVGTSDDSELDLISVLDGADSLEVLESSDVCTGEDRATDDCGEDSVLWLSVTMGTLEGSELFSETVLAAAVLLPKVAEEAAADCAVVDTAGI